MKDQIAYNVSVLEKIDHILHQLTDEELARPFALLFGSSVGGHVRHILEFYEELLTCHASGTFSYDQRERNLLIATEVIAARASAARSKGLLEELTTDGELWMDSELPGNEPTSVLRTTLKRELAYLADHGVHHLAMVRIALEQCLPHIHFPEHLGVAASTRNHLAR